MTEEYIKAQEAFIPYYKGVLEANKERILEHVLPDRPSWDKLISTEYAKDVFHDMVVDHLYDGMIKGRTWE